MKRLYSKNVHSGFYGLLLLSLFLIQATAQAGDRQGLLWEITPDSGESSYLFGTIHSEDPRVTNLPSPVRQRFENAQIFCAEMKLDTLTQIQMSQGMMYLNGQKLSEQIDPDLYKKTVTLITKYGVPEQMAGMFKPWAAGLLLSVPKPETGNFLDYSLYQKAQKQDKALCGLEKPGDIIALFDNTPMKTQVSLLKVAVREHARLDDMIEEMLKLYLDRDLSALQAYSDRELEKSGADVSALVNERLIEQRNRNMLETMQAQLKKGNAFIAVGALHLPGDIGLLHMLEKQGYRVKAVY